MKIRSDIRAGADGLHNCQQQRDYWKAQAERMEAIAKGPGTWKPPVVNPPVVNPPVVTPPSTTQPTGGWVGGVWYGDRSGWCG